MRKIYDPMETWRQKPTSLRNPINTMCWDRQSRDAAPAPMLHIGNCEMDDCPLYPGRTNQRNTGNLRGGDLMAMSGVKRQRRYHEWRKSEQKALRNGDASETIARYQKEAISAKQSSNLS